SEAWGPLRARAAHADPLDVIARARVGDAEVRWLEERPLTWRCRCSDEAVRGMLAGLGADALRELADEDHGAEITCHFCNEVRTLSEAELRALIPAGDA
ncbi:MAG TPA: Hsp33 family molecular chaperone HslO, partial [Myxococcota bacterium]|nr:Hsp33 family molecular chaperone HslO [Myxococcota bacterium]